MKVSEINKTIAEYMGYNYCIYTTSLDALIPVWEKLDKAGVMIILNTYKGTGYGWNIEVRVSNGFDFIMSDHSEYDRDKPLTEAAAIATAKAIQSLEDSKLALDK